MVVERGRSGGYGRAVWVTRSGGEFRNGGVVPGDGALRLGQLRGWLPDGIVARRVDPSRGNPRHGTLATHVRLLLPAEQIAKA